jgi:hypothetical protein
MNDFLKMDLFFVVTTAVVFLAGLFLLVALFYIVRILQSADHVMKNVRDESDSVRGDLDVLRGKIRDEGMRLKHFGELFETLYKRNTAPKKKHKAKEAE